MFLHPNGLEAQEPIPQKFNVHSGIGFKELEEPSYSKNVLLIYKSYGSRYLDYLY